MRSLVPLLLIAFVLASCGRPEGEPDSGNAVKVSGVVEGEANSISRESTDEQPEDLPPGSGDPIAVLEVGDTFEFRNKNGSMHIAADSELERTFTWDGASRSVVMERRKEPWKGALGLYWPGPGDHWEEHNGVTRGVIQEQIRDFEDEAGFREWLTDYQHWYDAKYTPDGIVAGWSINLGRSQLNVELWRITIGGRQPEKLAGGSTEWLTWVPRTD
jgi:hypothetical protein